LDWRCVQFKIIESSNSLDHDYLVQDLICVAEMMQSLVRDGLKKLVLFFSFSRNHANTFVHLVTIPCNYPFLSVKSASIIFYSTLLKIGSNFKLIQLLIQFCFGFLAILNASNILLFYYILTRLLLVWFTIPAMLPQN